MVGELPARRVRDDAMEGIHGKPSVRGEGDASSVPLLAGSTLRPRRKFTPPARRPPVSFPFHTRAHTHMGHGNGNGHGRGKRRRLPRSWAGPMPVDFQFA